MERAPGPVSDGEQKDSLHHSAPKETLWEYFTRERWDRMMEGTHMTLLLNLRLTEHLWYAGDKPPAPNC